MAHIRYSIALVTYIDILGFEDAAREAVLAMALIQYIHANAIR